MLALTSFTYCLLHLNAEVPFPYHVDFEAPEYNLGSIHAQHYWQVQQGSAEIRAGAGRDDTQGLVILPSDPFGQASLMT